MPVIDIAKFCKAGFPNVGSLFKHKGHEFIALKPWTAGVDGQTFQVWKAKTCSIKVYCFRNDKTGAFRWNIRHAFFERAESAFDLAIAEHARAMRKARKLLSNYGDVLESTAIDLVRRYESGELPKDFWKSPDGVEKAKEVIASC